MSRSSKAQDSSDYVSSYREYKYQETLFELYSRQFEAARLDESKEGSLIQVIDQATPPEKRSKPKRGATAIITTVVAFLLMCGLVTIRHLSQMAAEGTETGLKMQKVKAAWRRAFFLK